MAENGLQPMVVRTERGLSLAGTQITPYEIMDYLKAEWPPKLIQQWLDLSDPQIVGTMQYLAEHRDEVEAEYQLVAKQAAEARAYWEERNRERLARGAALPPKPGQEVSIAKLRSRKAELGLV